MRKQRRASLGVIDRAANVSAISRPDDDRRREIVVGAPAHSRELVTKLHVGGPDVIEELDLDYRLESTNGKTNRAPNDVGFSKWRIVHPRPAKLFLQAPGDFEHATLALHLAQIFFARDIRDILTEDENLLVAAHLVLHARVEEIDHRRRLA